MLKYLARITSRHKLKSLIPGMFTSKLIYALQLTASIWGLPSYGETELNKQSCPRGTMLKLQTAQRRAAALLCPNTPIDHLTPTSLILQEANLLSVHQLAALSILTLAIRVLHTGKPTYLADRFKSYESRGRSQQLLQVPKLRLSLSHEGFINQAIRLINKLPLIIINEPSNNKRKRLLKDWVKNNIMIKP